MTAHFTDKSVLVTGAGSGIGRAVALAFAREGGRVAVAGRRDGPLKETVALIADGGGDAVAFAADVTRPDEVRDLVGRTAEHFGGLDVAVNCVGTLTAWAPVADLDEAEWQRGLDTNLTSVFLSLKHEAAYMRAHGGGAIVTVSSNIGPHRRVPGASAYVAAKAAVSALVRNAALDHIGDGVRINAVSPGAADSPMSTRPGETAVAKAARLKEQMPHGRPVALDEIAAAVLYLASDEAGSTVGADLVVDGGVTA